MSSQKKNKQTTTDSLPALRIGSRVRCSEDGVEGRITWANGISVKIRWDDDEQVTWRRDSLAGRPIEIIDRADNERATDAKETTADGEPSASNSTSSEESSPQTLASGEDQTELLPPATEAIADDTEPATAEPASPAGDSAAEQTLAAITDVAEAAATAKRRRKTSAAPKEKQTSALDAAAQVLAEAGQSMSCQEMIVAMSAKNYWTSPSGKTPTATLYSAILKEITVKGNASRFVKSGRGQFALVNGQ